MTILHVEDDPLVARMVGAMLGARGWQVEHYVDGRSGLARIEGDARYGVIVLDNDLPGVTGLALLRRARELPHRALTPVVMFTSSECEAEARACGANDYLWKPFNVAQLVEMVERLAANDGVEEDRCERAGR